jgi:HPt (histidine-containing phosphotransfer) domain-containing protein
LTTILSHSAVLDNLTLSEPMTNAMTSDELNDKITSILTKLPLNHQMLENMRQEMRGRGIDWLLDLYLRELPNYTREITEALAANSGEQLYLAAHKFKGGSANLGADQIVSLCRLFENLGKQEDLKAANQLLPTFEAMMQQLRVEIINKRENGSNDGGPSRT